MNGPIYILDIYWKEWWQDYSFFYVFCIFDGKTTVTNNSFKSFQFRKTSWLEKEKNFLMMLIYQTNDFLKVRNTLLCTVSYVPFYVIACSPGLWDWPTWLNKHWYWLSNNAQKLKGLFSFNYIYPPEWYLCIINWVCTMLTLDRDS